MGGRGGHKIGKMSLHGLWTAPNTFSLFQLETQTFFFTNNVGHICIEISLLTKLYLKNLEFEPFIFLIKSELLGKDQRSM